MHSKGVMHRDIKTDNLMLDRDGILKIVDFDYAEFLSDKHPLDYKV